MIKFTVLLIIRRLPFQAELLCVFGPQLVLSRDQRLSARRGHRARRRRLPPRPRRLRRIRGRRGLPLRPPPRPHRSSELDWIIAECVKTS